MEYFLKNGEFDNMIHIDGEVLREQVIGNSKLDFLVGNTFIEVKTVLQNIQLPIPSYVRQKKLSPFSSVERLCRHVIDLKNSLANHERAIMLLVFIYDNPGFKVSSHSTEFEKVSRVTTNAFMTGVELWQANFEITPYGLTLNKYFHLDFETIIES